MSGSLANRLVEAGAIALNGGHERHAVARRGAEAATVLGAALRVLAFEAMEDMRTAHEAAQASRIDTHKHDFLGERAAYLRMHERLVELAGVVEGGEQE